jgi:putative tricarboxylic transport membrane protein
VALANWRGIVAPPGLTAGQLRVLSKMVDQVVHSAAWRETLRTKGWSDLYLAGDAFEQFLREEDARVAGIVRALGTTTSEARATPGARVFPWVILLGAAGVAVGIARQALQRTVVDAQERAPANRRALWWVAAALAAHVLLIETAGFPIAAMVLFVMAARGFGSTRPLRDLAIATIFSMTVFIGFTRGLGLTLPSAPRWILRGNGDE